MKSRDFCFWLQGFLGVSAAKTLDTTAVDCVRRHLNLVFAHEIDPSIDGDNPAKKQQLNDVHGPDGHPPRIRC